MPRTRRAENPAVIGVDFDNTLADYSGLIRREALRRRLISGRAAASKRVIRDLIRRLPDGEMQWRRLQAVVYGPKMGAARLPEGATEFLTACRGRGVPVHIISHKKSRYPLDPTGTDFRAAALRWMSQRRFFDPRGLGLRRSNVHFTATRRAKVLRIGSLGCTHFIDDLEETFQEPGFPRSVIKILYSPENGSRRLPGVTTACRWKEIRSLLFEREATVSRLLGRPIQDLEPLGRGRNSQVYRAATADGRRYAVKFYFRHASDRRDRLATEFGALRFLWDNGLRTIPRPLAADRERGCAAYEYIGGRPMVDGPASARDIDQSVAFLLSLHRLSKRCRKTLPAASEAYFTPRAIAENLHVRLRRLKASCRRSDPRSRALTAFLSREFAPAHRKIMNWCGRRLKSHGWHWDHELPTAERTLSPSDFGLHNALRLRSGKIKFLDFEYFGWDDPAKMIADFLLHPAMRLTGSARRRFLAGMLAGLGDRSPLRDRVELVYPLFGLKWCLILLNEFLPEERLRRSFAEGRTAPARNVLARQLGKARTMLRRIRREYREFPYYD